MEPKKPNSSFSTNIPGLQTSWDATCLSSIQRCAFLYATTYIEQLEPLQESISLKFGTAFHSSLETYTKAIFAGAPHKEAQALALRHAHSETGDYTKDKEGNIISFTPWVHSLPRKEMIGIVPLLRAIIWYTDTYIEDDFVTVQKENGDPAIELSFTLPAGQENLAGEPYFYVGHMDRLAEWRKKIWVCDWKTTSQSLDSQWYRDTFDPTTQGYLYMIAGNAMYHKKVDGIMYDLVGSQVYGTKFDRLHLVWKGDEFMNEFLAEQYQWIKFAEACALAEEWPRNFNSCGMYGGCPLRDLCTSPKKLRGRLANSLLKRREEPWDPAKAREGKDET